MGSSYFLQSPLYQSLTPAPSYSPSLFVYSNNAEHNKKKKKKKSTTAMASLRHENPNETNFCRRRSIFFVGISAFPFIQSGARAIEGLVKG